MLEGTSEIIFEKGKAGYPALYLLSPEDLRSQREIQVAAKELKRELFIWTLGKGIVQDKPGAKPMQDTQMPAEMIEKLPSLPDGSIIVLRLFHHFMDDPMVQSRLLDYMQPFKVRRKMLVVLTPVLKLPTELEKEFALIESALPDKKTLGEVLQGIITGTGISDDKLPTEDLRHRLVESATGLTTGEAENAFALSIIRPKRQGSDKFWDPDVVMKEKVESLKKTGLLEFMPPSGQGMNQIGGMANLKEWVSKRKKAFTDKAREYGLPAPKGILLVGPPGSGKSLGARATSEELGIPLLRCDMGKIFAGLVGESESNARKVILTAEAVAPCVLWLDEIEKGFAGSQSGLDSGVGARVLGTFLTWMQEKKAPVFVYATANNIRSLPPELLRKGRFDETFSVMYPNEREREEIFRIHLGKRGRTHLYDGPQPKLDLKHFVKITAGYSGAEIEAAIVEAMFSSFAADKELNTFDLQDAIDSTMPLSKMMEKEIAEIEAWCKDRTRPANSSPMSESAIASLGRMVEA